jgi:hypothetical protein
VTDELGLVTHFCNPSYQPVGVDRMIVVQRLAVGKNVRMYPKNN